MKSLFWDTPPVRKSDKMAADLIARKLYERIIPFWERSGDLSRITQILWTEWSLTVPIKVRKSTWMSRKTAVSQSDHGQNSDSSKYGGSETFSDSSKLCSLLSFLCFFGVKMQEILCSFWRPEPKISNKILQNSKLDRTWTDAGCKQAQYYNEK